MCPDDSSSDPPPPQSLEAWDRLAEHRIREAQRSGEFAALPGFGKPLPGIDEPHDENWWAREKLKRERVSALPPALEIRRDVERTLAGLASLKHEAEVRQQLVALNERIRQAHFAAIWGPPSTTTPVDIEAEVERWRAHDAK